MECSVYDSMNYCKVKGDSACTYRGESPTLPVESLVSQVFLVLILVMP
jgi:hypothetical protein